MKSVSSPFQTYRHETSWITGKGHMLFQSGVSSDAESYCSIVNIRDNSYCFRIPETNQQQHTKHQGQYILFHIYRNKFVPVPLTGRDGSNCSKMEKQISTSKKDNNNCLKLWKQISKHAYQICIINYQLLFSLLIAHVLSLYNMMIYRILATTK